jgi:hypothetical protein
MARTARKPKEDAAEELKSMDFSQAVKLYRHDIKPAVSKVGEHSQEVSTAYKAIKKHCNIPPSVAKYAFKLAETEDAKRDVELRALNGLLKELGIGIIEADLVDKANGVDETAVIPVASERQRPKLVTLPMGVPSDGTETDLADAAGDDAADTED